MLTILTPTYNRRHTLPRLFDSLCAQSRMDFEWLVVDDGSTDGTAQWLEEHKTENLPFTLRSLGQVNGGKHTAINAGVSAAQGEWVFIVDSDDLLTPDAVESVFNALNDVSKVGQQVVGVCFRKRDIGGEMVGLSFTGQSDPVLGSPSQMGRKVQGDLAYVFRRDIMVGLPFPVIPKEKFVPELYVWNMIGDLGVIWFYLDRAIYLCEYLSDGYTHNFREHLRRNPGGFLLYYAAQVGRELRWINKLKIGIRSVQCLVYCIQKSIAERKSPRH